MTYIQIRSWGVPKGPHVLSTVHILFTDLWAVSWKGAVGSEPFCHLSFISQPPSRQLEPCHHTVKNITNVFAFTGTGLGCEIFVHFQSTRKEGKKFCLPLKANAQKQYVPLFLLQIYILDYYHVPDPDKWNESLTHQNSIWNNHTWQNE